MHNRRIITLLSTILLISSVVSAQTHDGHATPASEPVDRPKVFLDKSPRVVWYQLDRLENDRLLLVERKTDDPKYAPVYEAILTRAGISPQHREQALQGLVELNASDETTELLSVLDLLDATNPEEQRTSRELAKLLLTQSPQVLQEMVGALRAATESDNGLLRSVGYAGLIVADNSEAAWSLAQRDSSSTLDWLASIPLIPDPKLRSSLRQPVVALLAQTQPVEVRRAAIEAIALIPTGQAENFQLVAPLVSNEAFRTSAIRTLLRIPPTFRDPPTCQRVADALVEYAESTPAAERTADEFIDAMQLADQLLTSLPVDTARSYRQRLREITVRVVRIHTVEEEMRYDTTYFAVEAGRPVQVVLQNEDLMPHNFVLTKLGSSIKEVSLEGSALGPNPGFEGKPYVPFSDSVLCATNLVPPGKQEQLTFTAPEEPGEYPYVCTFPNHWMRMYGVMVVVEDLDAWLANPTQPADPLGFTRGFVQNWTLQDFPDDLATALHNRNPELGAQMFKEGTCVQCHKLGREGGAVGPDLTEVLSRHKQDKRSVLREILEPSYKVDPEYTLYNVVTADGQVISGIMTAQDRKTITVITNPEEPKPQVIARDEIDEMVKSSTSMMPKGVVDRFTQEEIFELLAYVLGGHAQVGHHEHH